MIRLRIEDSCCTRLLFDWQVEKWENLVRFRENIWFPAVKPQPNKPLSSFRRPN